MYNLCQEKEKIGLQPCPRPINRWGWAELEPACIRDTTAQLRTALLRINLLRITLLRTSKGHILLLKTILRITLVQNVFTPKQLYSEFYLFLWHPTPTVACIMKGDTIVKITTLATAELVA